MKTALVIPARWGSTRFPGKPMAKIAGRTLLERTIDYGRRAMGVRPDTMLFVATDDQRIARHAEALGCSAIMTDSSLTSGSGRTLAAARTLSHPPDYVVNLQGDAPFLPVQALGLVLDELIGGSSACVTPVARMSWLDVDALRRHKDLAPTSGTTCIRAMDGHALWFSKQIIPAIRNEPARRAAGEPCPVLRHLGLYGFSLTALEKFETTPPSFYEALEGLEQLRLIEMGVPIRTVVIDPGTLLLGGIDTPADVLMAERMILERGDPFGV